MSTDKIDHATQGKDDNGNITLQLEQITIDKVYKDGEPHKDSHLLGCFFTPEESIGEYLFFGEKGKELRGNLASGQTFEFEHADHHWELTVHFGAHGTWKRLDRDKKGVEESGTYTAQAGNGSGVPTGKSASA